MIARHLKKYSFLVLLLLVPFASLFAADESYIQSKSGPIKKGDSVTVTDDKFLLLPLTDWNRLQNLSVQNIISFELRQDTAVSYKMSFTCTLNISIKYYTSRDQQTPAEISNVDMIVKYDTATGKYFPADARYSFKNAYKVIVIVNSINSPEWGNKLPPVFRIKNQILIQRKYPWDPQAPLQMNLKQEKVKRNATAQRQVSSSDNGNAENITASPDISLGGQQLIIDWPIVSGAEEYDLEWTYIDKRSARGEAIPPYGGMTPDVGPYIIPDAIVADWMKNDNTRVTITGNQYTINLPYTDGYVITRVRSVSYQAVTNLRLQGQWQYTDGTWTSCVAIDSHEQNLNWQYEGSFAEEGKRKEVISYFDGSLRSRQVVTINNSDNVGVVAETIFDKMGRPTVSILPAPTLLPSGKSPLSYYPSFNQNTSGDPYSHLDIGSTSGSDCYVTAGKLSDATGAAQYYSANNPFLAEPDFYFTKYVPEAKKGFAFAVTEYTPDNTGRIRRQGGVGEIFQIGNGHETNYFYGKPLQKDLDRLFGMEAGDASHYLKNMVVDPNGQVSVSYVNSAGKTIATALAGEAPGNLDPLPSSAATEAKTRLNQALIKTDDFIRDPGSLVMKATATFLAAVPGTFTLHYSINPAAIITTPQLVPQSPQFCSNCYYDILVEVRDDCGQLLTSASSPPFNGTDIDVTCNPNPLVITNDLEFPVARIGEYTVAYTLRLNDEVIKKHTDYYITHNSDLKTIQTFFHEEMLNADLKACYNDCIDCKEKLGSLGDFTEKMQALLIKLNEEKYNGLMPEFNPSSPTIIAWINSTYSELYDNCQSITADCKAESPCDQKLRMLKMDVTPGGQYAIYDPVTFLVPSSPSNERQVSVLLNYKTDPNISDFQFTDEDGNLRRIKDPDVTEQMFIKAYIDHPEWADDFVKRHIEYCSYLWCTKIDVSYTFDETLQQVIIKGSHAKNIGYYDYGDTHALLNNDPFFMPGAHGAPFKTAMGNDLDHLSNVLRFIVKDAAGTVQNGKNIMEFVDWMLYCKPTSAAATATDFLDSWNNCDPSSGCRSLTAEWEMFRNYYLQLKSKYIRLAKLAWDPGCDNCFIGNDGISQDDCIPPGNIKLYNLTYEPATGGGYDVYAEYQAGTLPFMDDYLVMFTRKDPVTGIIYSESVPVEKDEMSVLIGHVMSLSDKRYTLTNIICQPSGVTGNCTNPSTGNGAPMECPIENSDSYKLQTMVVRDNGTPTGGGIYGTFDYEEELYISFAQTPTNVPVIVELRMQESDCNAAGPCPSSIVLYTKTILPPANGWTYLSSIFKTGTVYNNGTSDVYVDYHERTFYSINVYCQDVPTVEDPDPVPPSSCPSDPRAQYYRNKVRRFNEFVDVGGYLACMAANAPGAPTEAQSIQALRDAASANMNDAAINWLNTLKGVRDEEFAGLAAGTLSNTVLEDIIEECKKVAQKYIDIAPLDNIRAASTLPPGILSAGGYNNFRDIFIIKVPPATRGDGFNEDLLADPYPYDKTPFGSSPNIFQINADLCTNLTLFKNRWISEGEPNTFHSWLQEELKEDFILTVEELADLETKCQNNCKWLNDPLLIPVAFATPVPANPDHPFVDCNRVNALIDELVLDCPGVDPDLQARLYRTLLTNHINKALGYAFAYEDYAEFILNCEENSSAVLYNKPAMPLIADDNFACAANIMRGVFDRAGQEYERYIIIERIKFRNAYISKCLGNKAWANLEGDQYEYHYTLYYYDQSGNLVKTIPPEGVKLLTEKELELVEIFRDEQPEDCTGYGVPVSENKPLTLTQVSGQWQTANGKSMEMWMYSNGGTEERKLRFITPDNKFFYQAAIKDKKLWVELYSLLPGTGGAIEITLTNQAYADISALPPLQPWTHLVAQATSGSLTDGPLQLYLDGRKLTGLTGGMPAFPYEWEITGGFTLPAEDLAVLKHLRLYRRTASDNEVWEDYKNSCLSPEGLLSNWDYYNPGNPTYNPLTVWGRFNIPAPGSETTIGPGSTVEYINRFIVPDHVLPTNYYYNSLNQVVKQKTPDAGISEFIYDRLGRLIVSQNAEQKTPAIVDAQNPAGRFSYTKYDPQGRIEEVGEKLGAAPITEAQGRDESSVATWLASGTNRQVTITAYDVAPSWAPAGITQKNLRKRVAASTILSAGSNPVSNRVAASYYSYDISGNVQELTQENKSLVAKEQSKVTGSDGLKRIRYEYDLISGKVNKVLYQDGKWDQFYYQYRYDAENRLTNAYSSRVNYPAHSLWTEDASYRYYLHGPLARMELGQHKVQGVDYAYTLQGWLKGVNGTELNADIDMSNDGKTGSSFETVARDVIAFNLGYHSQDYKAIDNSANAYDFKYTHPSTPVPPGYDQESGKELFNGNISNALYAIKKIDYGSPTGYSYRYDQLNRLTAMNMHKFELSPGYWSNSDIIDAYKEAITYDANGNIKTYERYNATEKMDGLTYGYNLDANGRLLNNKLRHVKDAIGSGIATEDIDNQPDDNYEYDAIGNLIKDNTPGEQLTRINWTVYGKIAGIKKVGSDISYSYDASGNRIYKKQKPTSTLSQTETFYVRDAQGNTMGVYQYDEADGNVTGKWLEQHLYGSSRLGMLTPRVEITTPLANSSYDEANDHTEELGNRMYELTNHLGNILATVSDRKIAVDDGQYDIVCPQCYYESLGGPFICPPCITFQVSTDPDGQVDYYAAEVLTATDYYPFGMIMPGRTYSAANTYRYGFNGKENDNEVKGEGNQQDYGMRIYDPRLGKFLSVDPLMGDYPSLTPYQFASNSPIAGIDMDGLEFYYSADGKFLGSSGTSQMVFTADKVEEKTEVCADGTSIKTLVSTNSKSLNIDHNKFQVVANIVMHEGLSNDPNEYKNIAHANNNEAKSRKNSDMYKLLKSGYSSVPAAKKTALSDKVESVRANASRAGVISALTGATDPTDNARLWDGTDFLAWGLNSPDGTPQNKFEEYQTIKIPKDIFDKFKQANISKWGLSVNYSKTEIDPKTKKAVKVKIAYSIPATVFVDKNNFDADGNFSYSYPSSNGTKTLTATATAGQSIFWKISK